MRRVPISVLVALVALVAPAPLPAADERSQVAEQHREHLERLLRESAVPAGARVGADGRLLALRGRFRAAGDDRADRRDATAAARGFLKRHAHVLGLRPDLNDMTLARRTDDRGGTVLRFEQRHEGIPVDGGTVVVGLDASGQVIHLINAHVPGLDVETTRRVTAAEALARAEEALGAPFAALHDPAALVVAAGDKQHAGYRLAWRVHGTTLRPRAEWLAFVDALTGQVIRTHDLLRTAGPPCVPCNPDTDPVCGRVFSENPVVALDDPTLTDASNVDVTQTGCLLPRLTSPTLLNGLYATTSITLGRVSAPWNWLRSANQNAVDEVNAYYHIDRAKGYLNQLGFPGVMNFPIGVDAHDPFLDDNSHYIPAAKIVEFGTGGVDDAQDGDILYHEYGHAIQDNQVPNFGQSIEAGSLGEGFGDFWASALTDTAAATLLGAACVGEWDATAYDPWTGQPGTGCLRRVDGVEQYPRDQAFQVHDDGEMWSAALWLLRQSVGGPVADPMVIKSHTFLTPTAGFIDGADALLTADVALNGGAHAAAIDAAMAARGIPRSALPAPAAGLTQAQPFVCETAHDYANYEYKECRLTVPGATRVRFHFSGVEMEDGYDFVRISDAAFRQVQALTGAPFAAGTGSSAAVHGDTIVARFKADPLTRHYGFRIDAVEYASGAGAVPDGDDVQGTPLTIAHAGGGAIALSWGASCGGGTDYAVYEGTLGDYTSHLPVACSTGGLTSSTFIPPGHSTYYLVVPVVTSAEGSYGRRGDGVERPSSVSACRPQQILDTCS